MEKITKYSDRKHEPLKTLDHHQNVVIKEAIDLDKILNEEKISRGLVEWLDGGVECLKSFILQSKDFSKTIKDARAQGLSFVRHKSFLINVDKDSEAILPTDLTKQRFLAICHWALYEDGNEADRLFKSPLIMRAEIDAECPLQKVQCLLGIGYQFIGKKLLGMAPIAEKSKTKRVYFFGAYLLDYLSRTSQNAPEDDKIDIGEVTLKDYILNPANGGKGVVFAAYRNLGASDLFESKDFIKNMTDWSAMVKIGRFGGEARGRITGQLAMAISQFHADERSGKNSAGSESNTASKK